MTIATEVLNQLEADPAMKRTHLALYLRCKESLRSHKARQARNKRFGQFVRWLCSGLLAAPARLLRQGGEIAFECLPETAKEPAAPHVRRLTRGAEFARAQAAFDPEATTPAVATATSEVEMPPSSSAPPKAARAAA